MVAERGFRSLIESTWIIVVKISTVFAEPRILYYSSQKATSYHAKSNSRHFRELGQMVRKSHGNNVNVIRLVFQKQSI